MRKTSLVSVLGALSVLFAAIGCGGSGGGSTPNAHPSSVAGNWTGTFASDARLANAATGELAIRYTQNGTQIGGSAILTVDAGGGSSSYLGGVTGTYTTNTGAVDATITFDPALPGEVATVHVTGTVTNGAFSGTYSAAGGETGTITQSKFTGNASLAVGDMFTGTATATGGTAQSMSITVSGMENGAIAGAFTLLEFGSSFDGQIVGNRIVFGTIVNDVTAEFTGTLSGDTITGTFHSGQGEAEGHGTFTLTRHAMG